MKPCEVIVNNGDEKLREYVASFPSLHALAIDWMKKSQSNSVRLGNGIDDENEFSLVALILIAKEGKEPSEDVVEIYYPLAEAKEEFASYPLIENYVHFVKDSKTGRTITKAKEEEIEAIDRKMGFEFDEELLGPINSTEMMIPFMMSYAQSKGGVVELGKLSDDWYEDIDFEVASFTKNSVYCCHTCLFNDERNFSSHADYYFVER